MKKFQYNSLKFDNTVDYAGLLDLRGIEWADSISSPKDIYIHKTINALGIDGWELVSIIDKKEDMVFYFKKEINE